METGLAYCRLEIEPRRLGHYGTSMPLNIFGRLIPELQDEAAELIDELITSIEVQLHPIAHESENAQNNTPK